MRRWRPWPYISIMPCSRRLAWHESISQIFVFFLLEFSIKFYPSTSIIPFFVCCYVNQSPIFCTIYSFFTFFSAQEPEKCRIAPSALPSIRSPAHGSPDRTRSRSRKSGPCFPIGLLRPDAAAYIFPEPKTAPRRSCLRGRLPVAAETILTNPRGLCYI